MPITMVSSLSDMHYATSEEDRDPEFEVEDDEGENDDYSFSLSGFLEEEDAFVEPAPLSTALDDSISFTFSTRKAPDTQECATFDFTPSLPLPKYVHASSAFGSPHAYDDCACLHNDEDSENAALVPFKISASWKAESSSQHSAGHSESRRPFSFLTESENEEELAEESLIYFEGATTSTTEDLGIFSNGEDHVTHVGAAYDGVDEGKMCMYNGRGECNGEEDGLPKHACCDVMAGNAQIYTQRADIEENSSDLFDIFAHDDDDKHMKYEPNFPTENQSSAEFSLKFAGEGLLQPWSSSKLSKSGTRQTNANRYDAQRESHNSRTVLSRLHPFERAPDHDIKDNCDRKPGPRASFSRMRSSESVLFSPASAGTPTRTPICMPRKSSSLFARRMMRNTTETLSLLAHAQKANTNSFPEAMPSPSSNGSLKSSSYRTSSIGSTQSSGYSSSSGKCSGTPSSSRNSSKGVSHIAARWSLQQQMEAEHFTSQKKDHLHATSLRKEDPNPPLDRKRDDVQKQGVAYMHAQAAAQTNRKASTSAVQHDGTMSPATSSQSSRSPLNWRSVLSLQPLNPSHVPLDQWELMGIKPSSRSQYSQKSKSLSRGSSSKEDKSRNTSMSAAATSKGPLAMHANTTGMKASSSKEGIKPTCSIQKSVKNKRGFWPFNPMQWFRQCRNDQKQVVIATIKPCK